MRTTREHLLTYSALFEGDAMKRYVIVCERCEERQVVDLSGDDPFYCLICHIELFYRPWYEW